MTITGASGGSHFRPTPNCVVAVAVTYHPDAALLRRALVAASGQVSEVVVVDNGSPAELLADLRRLDRVHVIRLDENRGVATAQNLGIAEARARGATHVLLLDQDSVPAPNMVRELLAAVAKIESYGVRLAAVGPQWTNALNGEVRPFSPCLGIKLLAPHGLDEGNIVECDSIISAGTLVPIGVLDQVGELDDSLFIDLVDTEWCLRARSRGLSIFGVRAAGLSQSLGQVSSRIWLLKWISVITHRPFRYYYIFRNSVLLRRRAYVERAWRRCNLLLLVYLFVLHGVIVGPRRENLLMMWRGLREGRRGLTGKLRSSHL